MCNPPLNAMEILLWRYSRIIVKFFWMVLEFTEFGRKSHTNLPFDYFTLATMIKIKDEGIFNSKGECILKQEEYLKRQMPESSVLQNFGIQLNASTRVG